MKEQQEEDVNNIISENLLRLRNEKNYSQKQIAKVLSIKQPSYNRMETGETKLDADKLYRLARFYRVSVTRFFKNQPKVPTTRIPSGGKLKGGATAEVLMALLLITLFCIFLMLYIASLQHK